MRGNESPGRIVTNFCTGVGVHDVITSANFYDSRIRGFSVVGGGQILGFSIDLHRRPYNTLALPCECVVMILTKFWFCRELAHLCRCHAVNVYLVSIYWSGSWHNKNGRSQSLTLLYNFCHQNPSRKWRETSESCKLVAWRTRLYGAYWYQWRKVLLVYKFP